MFRTALALGTMLLVAAPATAQYIGGGFAQRSSFGFSVRGPGFRFSSFSRSYFYSAPAFGFGWMPAFGPGYGPGFGNPLFLPPPPIVVGPAFVPPPPIANDVPYEIPPEVVKADFRVIMPRKKNEVPIAPIEKPMARFDPFAKDKPVGLTEPALDVNQQMKLARDALAAGEYGAASEHLDRVLQARPEDLSALFLKSQAQFAAGQYSEAVATIRAGVKADAKWPRIDIQPRNLFGKEERFDGLFGDLKRSRDANPDSLALQFLVAHQHWFAGDRDAAKAAFARLADRLNDPDAVKPFLK